MLVARPDTTRLERMPRAQVDTAKMAPMPIVHGCIADAKQRLPISDYLRDLRALVGRRLLLLPGVAGIVRDAEGRVLFMRRADNGKWGLPAGAIDPGETPAEAIVREVREETGLEVRPVRVAGVFGGSGFRVHYENGDEAEYTVIVFDCEVVGGQLSPADGEALELRYFAPDEAPELQVAYPRSLLRPPRNAAEPPQFEGALSS